MAENAPAVVVINRAMTRYWDPSDPIGSRISLDSGQTWSTIVGVVGDVKQFGLDQRRRRAGLHAAATDDRQGSAGWCSCVRTATRRPPRALIRDAAWAIDPNMPVQNVRTLDEIRDRYLATPRLTAVLLTLFAALALLVTMAGITGVIATSVSQRTQEFGVRMALGASRATVLQMVIRQGLALVCGGLLVGILAAVAVTRVLSSYLFDTTADRSADAASSSARRSSAPAPWRASARRGGPRRLIRCWR